MEIPVYSFVLHQRTAEKRYLYGPAVIIVEGIFVLHDPPTRSLLDLKIFVQADSDLMLARRIKRDMIERGRDIGGILDQYLRFVKPSMDNFVSATSKFADIIVPGQNNTVAIDVICQQIRRQLELRDEVRLREKLSLTPATPRRECRESPFDKQRTASPSSSSTCGGLPAAPPSSSTVSNAISNPTTVTDLYSSSESPVDHLHRHPLESKLPPSVHVLRQTPQLKALLTILHDVSVAGEDFVFTVDRLATLVMEESMAFLPYQERPVQLVSGKSYIGTSLSVKDVCSVSILRSGAVLESSARRVLPALTRGSLLIQSAADGEARLYTLDLPACVKDRQRAASTRVLVLDSQIGTGAAALMCIRVLLDHGVREEHIVFCCLLASAKGGVHALHCAFPAVRIIVAGVDPDLKRRIVWQRVPVRRAMPDARPEKKGPALGSLSGSSNGHLSPISENNQRLRHLSGHNGSVDNNDDSTSHARRVCFAIRPGAGNVGDRYFGTTSRPAVAQVPATTDQELLSSSLDSA